MKNNTNETFRVKCYWMLRDFMESTYLTVECIRRDLFSDTFYAAPSKNDFDASKDLYVLVGAMQGVTAKAIACTASKEYDDKDVDDFYALYEYTEKNYEWDLLSADDVGAAGKVAELRELYVGIMKTLTDFSSN